MEEGRSLLRETHELSLAEELEHLTKEEVCMLNMSVYCILLYSYNLCFSFASYYDSAKLYFSRSFLLVYLDISV